MIHRLPMCTLRYKLQYAFSSVHPRHPAEDYIRNSNPELLPNSLRNLLRMAYSQAGVPMPSGW